MSISNKNQAVAVFGFALSVIFYTLFGLNAHAGQPFGGQYYPKKGQCIMSYPLKMTIVGKGKGTVYMAVAGVNVVNALAAITITSHTASENETLNSSIEYVGSKDVPMANGFTKTVDIWKECKLSQAALNNKRRSDSIGQDELNRFNRTTAQME